MNIVEYLISIGYKSYRWSKRGYVPCNNVYDFSSLREGGLDVRFVKNNSLFIYGLHEKDKPPTLIYPRTCDLRSDDQMNRYLTENSGEFVFEKLKHLVGGNDYNKNFKLKIIVK